MSAQSRSNRFTLAGGVLALVGGTGHLVASALMRRDVWAQVADEGFLNTVTLDPAPDRLGISEAFWFSPGSFGVPLLLLGALVTWHHRRDHPTPGWLGAGLLVWATLLGLVSGFDAGTMILLSIGLLLLVGGTRSTGGTFVAGAADASGSGPWRTSSAPDPRPSEPPSTPVAPGRSTSST